MPMTLTLKNDSMQPCSSIRNAKTCMHVFFTSHPSATTWRRHAWRGMFFLAAAGGLFCSGTSPSRSAEASAVPPISRTILEQQPIAGTDREMDVILVVYQPGVVAPKHHHSSAGFNYVLEGTAESAYGNETPRQYRAGETFMDQADVPHTLFRNPDQHKLLRFLIVANVKANQPYTFAP